MQLWERAKWKQTQLSAANIVNIRDQGPVVVVDIIRQGTKITSLTLGARLSNKNTRIEKRCQEMHLSLSMVHEEVDSFENEHSRIRRDCDT